MNYCSLDGNHVDLVRLIEILAFRRIKGVLGGRVGLYHLRSVVVNHGGARGEVVALDFFLDFVRVRGIRALHLDDLRRFIGDHVGWDVVGGGALNHVGFPFQFINQVAFRFVFSKDIRGLIYPLRRFLGLSLCLNFLVHFINISRTHRVSFLWHIEEFTFFR